MPLLFYILIFSLSYNLSDSTKYCKDVSKSVKCVHGSCINDSRAEKCVCDRGWGGPSCESCGGRVRLKASEPGYIIDGYHNYTLDTKCTWLVQGTPNVPIQLTFEHFATECSWDHLYVYDGNSIHAPLVAAFSGLMLTDRKSATMQTIPSLTLESGYAYLHFYSDAAYNMSGFNISYRTNSCPQNCSGRGVCQSDWTCDCDQSWIGVACDIPRCPNNCSKNGICGDKCDCLNRFSGIDCSIPEDKGFWEEEEYTVTKGGPDPQNDRHAWPLGRASHKAVLIDDNIWIVGGYDFNVRPYENVMKYNILNSRLEVIHPSGSSNPAPRYGHSLVTYEKKLIMFGGVIQNKITDELWVFDIDKSEWIPIEQSLILSVHTGSHYYAVVGHTAHIVGEVMYVVFGHSPVFGYLNSVQECNMSNYVWTIPNTTGAIIKGGYGHTSVYDPETKLIYVHGGYHSGGASAYHLSDSLYAYSPHKKVWYILSSSSVIAHPQYLHSAVINDGLVLFYGGNTHNDTSMSFGAKCYSSSFMAYDIKCDEWYKLSEPLLSRDISRFGHTAVLYSFEDTNANKVSSYMYMFGGFNGLMLSDMFKYTPGNCPAHENNNSCLNSHEGVKCVWADSKICLQRSDAKLRKAAKTIQSYEERICPKITVEDRQRHCAMQDTCPTCVQTKYGCTWCENKCIYDTDKGDCDGKPEATDVSVCETAFPKYSSHCSTLHNCFACLSDPVCAWDDRNKKCDYNKNDPHQASIKVSLDQCHSACHTYDACENCTLKGCMWCSNQQRCVEPNAYVASFPYAQCREWTTNGAKCPATRCSDLRTCGECERNPACGWCDDGSDTGLGGCMEGGLKGPEPMDESDGVADVTVNGVDEETCPSDRWYFVTCPLCQCNGHSTCSKGTDVCLSCEELTTGPQCEHCKDGYFGTPTNGGNCTACECNGQADSCDRDNGSCYCRTRGVIGAKCDQCDKNHKYYGSPHDGGTCYYELATDYQFTFNLSKPEDSHYNQINFFNIPLNHERDVDFQINCSSAAKINISIRANNGSEEMLITELTCSKQFKKKFSHTKYRFGKEYNTTFYVYVYGFNTPFWLLIAFSQFPQIDLLHFFVTFISCFLSLLLIAVVLWKVKQKYDLYRRAQRMRVEREQWANRPFGTCHLIVDTPQKEMMLVTKKEPPDQSNHTSGGGKHDSKHHTSSTKNKHKLAVCNHKPGYIAIEQLSSTKAAAVTVIIQLPTGDEDYAPPGHCGISLGTSLVSLGGSLRSQFDQTKTDKTAGKVQIPCQNNSCPPEYIV